MYSFMTKIFTKFQIVTIATLTIVLSLLAVMFFYQMQLNENRVVWNLQECNMNISAPVSIKTYIEPFSSKSFETGFKIEKIEDKSWIIKMDAVEVGSFGQVLLIECGNTNNTIKTNYYKGLNHNSDPYISSLISKHSGLSVEQKVIAGGNKIQNVDYLFQYKSNPVLITDAQEETFISWKSLTRKLEIKVELN